MRIDYPTYATTFTYDVMGRVVTQTDILAEGNTQSSSYTYDEVGNVLTVTDEEFRVTRFEYDALGRLVKTIDPLLNETRSAFDDRGNLRSVTDAGGGITYYEYDRNNRRTRAIKPLLQETVYEYDAGGNRTAVVDAKGQRIEYDYDARNLMTQVRYFAAGNHATPVKTVDFTYDGLGNLKTYADGTTTGTYIYDDLSQKIAETIDYGAFTKTIGYDYYANGLKKSFTGPDGAAVSYSYDEGNRLSAITIPGIGQITTNAYHWNSPARVTLPGGSTTDYTYDPLMRLKTLTSKDPAQNTLVSRGYTYSPVGNMTAKATEHGTYAYTYDNLDRVLSAANPGAADEAYTYDGLGNRLTSAATTSAWAYNTNNELQGFDDAAFGYDANGNMTGRTQGAANISYQYDVENRLVEVEGSGGATIATYYYDPFGRRLWKEVAGTRTYFLYSDEGLIGEYDALGTELRVYGYAPDSAFSTDPLFQKSGGAYYWYRNDHLGTPQKVTSTSGSVAWAGKYDTFGNVAITSQAGFTSNLRFGGQYFDAETGLYYNYQRYYDPTLGRYLQSDPYGDGINLYAYVYNNPNSLFDPMGLCAVKNFFTLDGQAQFWAGFGDFLTSGFGISYMFGLPSLTEYARTQWQQAFGWDDPINYESDLYAAGAFTGDVVASIMGEALVAKALAKVSMSRKIGWASSKVSKKTVVIGEGMDSIKTAARGLRKEGINAKWYQAWKKNFPQNRRMTPKELDAALKRNKRWIESKMKEGYDIYDIGPDGRNSPFYSLEKQMIEKFNYPTTPLERP